MSRAVYPNADNRWIDPPALEEGSVELTIDRLEIIKTKRDAVLMHAVFAELLTGAWRGVLWTLGGGTSSYQSTGPVLVKEFALAVLAGTGTKQPDAGALADLLHRASFVIVATALGENTPPVRA